MGDVIQIGSNYYAVTLNLFLTALFGLLGSIAYFRYQRKIKRQDDEKQQLENTAAEALAQLVEIKHDTLLEKFDETKKAIVGKIDSHCAEQARWQGQVDDRFYCHGHRLNTDDNIADEIIIRKYAK